MMKPEDVRKKLKGMNLTKVSKASKVHYGKIYRLVNKASSVPTYETIEKLSKWLVKTPPRELKLFRLKWVA